ncbi:MAG TPA: protein translocase subunit SecD [Gemmatimonadales bacterium]|jgi:preprotein translocase subunit SecD|nr:protein translocase subunit SecD [Gemmatimonadales bacterium]
MFASIRSRIIVIALLTIGSIYFLFPRTVTIREPGANGVMRDTAITRVPLKRGLDLQGGMHLALELDQSKQVSSDPKRDIDLALTVLRKRIDEFGVEEPLIQKAGDERIVVELAGITQPERAKAIVQRSAFLEFRITDKTNALEKALPAMDRTLRGLGIKGDTSRGKPSAVEQLLGDTGKKADTARKADTTSKAAAAKTGGKDAGKPGGKEAAKPAAKTAAKPAAKDSAAPDSSPAVSGGVLEGLIQPAGAVAGTSTPGEYVVPEPAFPRVDSLLSIPQVARQLPRGLVFRWASAPTSIGVQPYRYLYVLDDRPIVTGANLEDAQATIDQLTQGAIVTFQLDRAGGRKFGEETGRHVGDFMAILLDGRVQGRPPVIQSRIGRNGQITLGNKSLQEAQDLALTLKAGALPIPLKIVEERQVGATLGADSIKDGITAGLVGTAMVVVIMLVFYRVSGALAVLALALYILFTLGGLSMIDATLTLPGLAGIVLSVGIAVDANVLIFERIREELQHGKTVRLSVDEGFKHAMNAIIDSNVSTVLTALFLFQFGTGPVKGFAVTLIMGIAASMITAVFVTRTFFMIWLQRRPTMATLSI